MSLNGTRAAINPSKAGNRLIDNLPLRQRNGFLSLCEPVELAFGTVLCEAGQLIDYAYFPITGNITLVNQRVGSQPIETANIGKEGMLGATLLLGSDHAPQSGMVQTPCLAFRLKAKRLKAALERQPELSHTLQRYLYVVLLELSRTVACSHFHDVGGRLARSLLVAHDGSETDHVYLTHQMLADMLGVQRGAVTLAAIKWQREGIISYSRGKISILDRKRLLGESCGCYDESVENYASMFS